MIAVFGIVATGYGTFSLIYNYNHGKGLSGYGLLLLILGILALGTILALYVISYITKRKHKNETFQSKDGTKEETKESNLIEEPRKAETTEKKEELKSAKKVDYTSRPESRRASSYSYSYSTVYIKQVGYGPILRVEGSRIIDMRTNTYYRIEGNMVIQDGYGPVFEIRDNQIKDAFGSYLYEISGSNINKVFGGFYASVGGNYITLYDLSVKYEMTDSISKKQLLAISALLFGRYWY